MWGRVSKVVYLRERERERERETEESKSCDWIVTGLEMISVSIINN